MNDASSIFNLWWELPPFVEFLRKSREKEPSLINSCNVSIILHSATIIEGFISQFINDELKLRDSPKSFDERLRNDFNQKIESASWTKLTELYSLKYGKELSSETGNEIWKGIVSLFQLRNLLVHSSPLIVSHSTEDKEGKEKSIFSAKYEKIYNFLAIENKLIDEISYRFMYPFLNLITDKSADFYWENTKLFLKDILSKQEASDSLTKTMFERSFNSEIKKIKDNSLPKVLTISATLSAKPK